MKAKKKMWKVTSLLLGGSLWLMAQSGMALAADTPVELTVKESVERALQVNPQIGISKNEQLTAWWKVKEARGARGFTITYTHTDVNKKVGMQDITQLYDNKLAFSMPIYTGGKIEASIDYYKQQLKISDVGVDKANQQVKFDATNGYYSVVASKNGLKVAQESVDALSEHLKNVQAQFNVGIVAKSDVLRSEVELANSQQALIKAQNTYDLAMANLNNVIGLPLGTTLVMKDELAHNPYAKTLEDCIEYAMKNRPDVIQADAGVEAAKANVTINRSGYLPTVSIGAYQDWNDNSFPGNNENSNNWMASITTTWTIFDSEVTKSKVKEAQATLEKAKEQARQAKDNIKYEVRQNYLSLREAEKRIETSKVAVARSEEDFKIAQVRYSAGVGTNLDVMDAQVAMTTAKNNYIQALFDYNSSWAKLEKSMGVSVKQ